MSDQSSGQFDLDAWATKGNRSASPTGAQPSPPTDSYSPYEDFSRGTESTTHQFAAVGENPFDDGAGATSSAPVMPAPGGEGFVHTAAPVVALLPSLVLGVISLGISAFLFFSSVSPTSSTYLWLSLAAWALAGVIGISLLALFRKADTRERARGVYVEEGWRVALYWGTMALLVIGVVWSAIELALWFGKVH